MFSHLSLFDNPYSTERTILPPDPSSTLNTLTYPQRLATFYGHWDANICTARQLAALGHICDRPPIEAIEEGSHCISCAIFVRREEAVRALEGPLCRNTSNGDNAPTIPNLHHPNCERLQVRIPLETRTMLTGSLSSYNYRRSSSQTSSSPHHPPQTTSFSSPPAPQPHCPLLHLPIELLHHITSYLLPAFPKTLTLLLYPHSTTLTTSPALPPHHLLPVLQTSQTLHQTLLPLLFPPTTTYTFPSTKTAYLFLRQISPHGRHQIKRISIPFGSAREDAISAALLSSCPNLKILTLKIPRPVLLPPHASLWMREGISALLEISGLEEVRFLGGNAGDTRHTYLDETRADGKFLQEKLCRPRGEASGMRWVGGHMDL